MGTKLYTEMREQFTEYLIGKQLRKTEERYTIFERICHFPGHFDITLLYQDLEEQNYHVSKATLYNTIEVLIDAGLIVRHQLTSQSVQYELRRLAETHQHLICTKCGAIREIRNQIFKTFVKNMRVTRFTPEFHCLYIYGVCSKCKYKKQTVRK
ncbi:Fur family transcriptional regulator [Parabacteroides sp. PF5-9]|uniref:Fur family transcriptional regulator n=1 Tax=Parabacteroides sp. PF5-9 TaxID=1742404 RepID=UPI0032AEDA8D